MPLHDGQLLHDRGFPAVVENMEGALTFHFFGCWSWRMAFSMEMTRHIMFPGCFAKAID